MQSVNIIEWIPQNVYRTCIQQDLLPVSIHQLQGVFKFCATWTTSVLGHHIHLPCIFYTADRMTFTDARLPDLSQMLDEVP